MQYHLDQGVDPNYQHPEMESTALCEAIRAGNIDVVKYLLEYNKNPAPAAPNEKEIEENKKRPTVDPTIPSAYENETPLEIAMELRHHEMIDAILEALPSNFFDEESKYCKAVLVTLPMETMTAQQVDLTRHVLKLGHRLILAPVLEPPSKENDLVKSKEYLHTLDTLKQDTGNSKIWTMPLSEVPSFLQRDHSSKIFPTKLDSWLSFLDPDSKSSLLDELVQSFECLVAEPTEQSDSNKKRSTLVGLPDQMLLLVPSTIMNNLTAKEQLSLLFKMFASSDDGNDAATATNATSSINAMIVPHAGVWGTTLAYKFLWKDSWLDSITNSTCSLENSLSTSSGDVYNYKMQKVPFVSSFHDKTPVGDEWKEQCQRIVQLCRK